MPILADRRIAQVSRFAVGKEILCRLRNSRVLFLILAGGQFQQL